MIKIEKVGNKSKGIEIDYVLPQSLAVAIIGMRNPKNSWEKSDSWFDDEGFHIGEKDLSLATTLAQAGPVHGKFLRQIMVSATITAPIYWWKEFDTYKVGTTANSTSTMHKITSRDLTLEDFSSDQCVPEALFNLETTIIACNALRRKFVELKDSDPDTAKQYWYSLIQSLPCSYNQTRTVTMNYEVLSNIHEYRKHHKLDEWHVFCDWIETLPYAKDMVVRAPLEKLVQEHKNTVDLAKQNAETLEQTQKELEQEKIKQQELEIQKKKEADAKKKAEEDAKKEQQRKEKAKLDERNKKAAELFLMHDLPDW